MLVYAYSKTSEGLFNKYSKSLDIAHSDILLRLSTIDSSIPLNEFIDDWICKIRKMITDYFEKATLSISKFFSNKAISPDIQTVYTILRDNSRRYNKLNVCDINMAVHLFNEYLDGLYEFITIVHGVRANETPCDKILTKINTAIERDSVYIDSLFGGEDNKKALEDISECMKQVEYLIDFIPELNSYKDGAIHLINNVEVIDDMGLLMCRINAMYLGLKSIMYFTNKTISETTQLFFNICIDIKDKVPSMGQVEKPISIF